MTNTPESVFWLEIKFIGIQPFCGENSFITSSNTLHDKIYFVTTKGEISQKVNQNRKKKKSTNTG